MAEAAASDFVFVNLARGVIGAPVRPDAVGELLAAASRRAGLVPAVRAHQLRHAFGSNAADAGCGLDVVACLLGHASVSTSQVYVRSTLGNCIRRARLRWSPGERGPAIAACCVAIDAA